MEKVVPLKELCLMEITDGTHKTPKYSDTGYIFLSSKNVTTGLIDWENVMYIPEELHNELYKRVAPQKGDILLAKNGTTGIAALVDKDEIFDIYVSLALIRPNVEKVMPKYLLYSINSPTSKMFFDGNLKGIGVPNLHLTHIRETPIKLYPESKQREIVSTLDKVSNLISLRKQQLETLDEMVKSKYYELSEQNPAHNELGEFITPYKAERCGDKDLPVLSITKDDGIVLQSEKFKKRIASVDSSTYKIVPRGKLVQGIHIDERNFAIQNIVNEGIVSPAYKIWTVDLSKAVPEVLAYVLRTDRTMQYISSKFTGSVKRRESISMDSFMAIPTDLPPMEAQEQFAAFVEQTDKSKLAIQNSLDQLETLKKALMQEYFG
ncbi:MAG: restriction endonuclease subunit S [Oscillospiraceae bacterium]|nr:restriction endonuclease subunit S [Oscillospiraceae bacterium]